MLTDSCVVCGEEIGLVDGRWKHTYDDGPEFHSARHEHDDGDGVCACEQL